MKTLRMMALVGAMLVLPLMMNDAESNMTLVTCDAGWGGCGKAAVVTLNCEHGCCHVELCREHYIKWVNGQRR